MEQDGDCTKVKDKNERLCRICKKPLTVNFFYCQDCHHRKSKKIENYFMIPATNYSNLTVSDLKRYNLT